MSGSTTPRLVLPITAVAGIACAMVLLMMLAAATSPANAERSAADAGSKPVYDEAGDLQRPVDYRRWVYVGTPVTPNDMNGGRAAFPEFHTVYINPWAYKHYKKTGEFPDGTIMIKELASVGAKSAVSGQGYFMGDFLGVEAAVKDSKQFPDEPGNWAYFSFGKHPELAAKASAHPTAGCNSCHQASAAEDWVFTQYYPVLRALKAELQGE